jgi:hypothetical protein
MFPKLCQPWRPSQAVCHEQPVTPAEPKCLCGDLLCGRYVGQGPLIAASRWRSSRSDCTPMLTHEEPVTARPGDVRRRMSTPKEGFSAIEARCLVATTADLPWWSSLASNRRRPQSAPATWLHLAAVCPQGYCTRIVTPANDHRACCVVLFNRRA